jgi:hypothetical protein
MVPFINVDDSLETFPKDISREVVYVILQGIGYKATLHPDPGFTLVKDPAVFFSEKGVHNLIKIAIVAEKNMPPHIPPEAFSILV